MSNDKVDYSDLATISKNLPAERYKKTESENQHLSKALEDAPLVEMHGFDREEYHKKIRERNKALSSDELDKLVAEKDKNIILDHKQMKIFLKDINDRIGNNGFKKFIEEYCILDFNPDMEEEGIYLSSGTKKISIELNPQTFLEYGNAQYTNEQGKIIRLRRFNAAKAAFMIGRAIGSILEEPKDWQKVAPSEAILKGRTGSWEDFVALCIATPDEAKRIFPQAYEHFNKLLLKIATDPSSINIKKSKNEKLDNLPFELDMRTQREKEDRFFKGLDTEDAQNRRFMFNFLDYIKTTAKETGLGAAIWQATIAPHWKKTHWYQRAVSEFEDKEVGRIMTQNEGITDRDRYILQLVGDGTESISWENKFLLRTILMADMKFSDWGSWRIHAYLQATDDLYRQYHGEMITEESFRFITRLHRVSNATKRLGTKPTEYKLVEPKQEYDIMENGVIVTKEASRRVFVRRSRSDFQHSVNEEITTFTSRDILSRQEKECFEYMSRTDNKYYEEDEKFDTDKDKEGYMVSTGSLDQLLGKSFADNMIKNLNHRGPTSKLDPDQLATLGRIISEERVYQENLKSGNKTKEFFTEHTRQMTYNAYFYYQKAIDKNPECELAQIAEWFYKNRKGIGKGKISEEQLIKKEKLEVDEEERDLEKFAAIKEGNDKEEAKNYKESRVTSKQIDEREIEVKTASAKTLAKTYETLKSGEEALQKSKVDHSIERAKLTGQVKGVMKSVIKDSYTTKEPYIQEKVIEKIEEMHGPLTLSQKREVQKVIQETRAYRREIIRLRQQMEMLGILPYIDKLRHVKAGVGPRLLPIQQAITTQIEIIRKYEKEVPLIHIIDKVVEPLGAAFQTLGQQRVEDFPEELKKVDNKEKLKTELKKSKNPEDLVKKLSGWEQNLTRKINLALEVQEAENVKKAAKEALKESRDKQAESFKLRLEEFEKLEALPEFEDEDLPENDEQILEVLSKFDAAIELERPKSSAKAGKGGEGAKASTSTEAEQKALEEAEKRKEQEQQEFEDLNEDTD